MFTILPSFQQSCNINGDTFQCIFGKCQNGYGCIVNSTLSDCSEKCGKKCWYSYIPFPMPMRYANINEHPTPTFHNAYFCPDPILVPGIICIVLLCIGGLIAYIVLKYKGNKKNRLVKKPQQQDPTDIKETPINIQTAN